MTTNRFSAKDEGKLFYIIGDFPVTMFEFDGVSLTAPPACRGVVNIHNGESTLLYVGSRVPQPINGKLADFYIFLYEEKIIGLPVHLYDQSSNPIIFVEFGKDPIRDNARYGDNLPIAPIAVTDAALLKLAQAPMGSEVQEEKSNVLKKIRGMFLDFFKT